MARITDIESAPMSAAQRAVFEAIRAGPRGIVEGPLRIWLHSPELADRSQSLGAFCRYGSSLAPDLSELAILAIAAHWRAGFEWHVHAPIAARAGVPQAAIDAIRQGHAPELPSDAQALVHRFTRSLVIDRTVPSPIFDATRAALGDVGVVDLVGIIGYYTYIAMTIVAFEISVPDGAEPFA